VLRCLASVTYLSLSPYVIIHLLYYEPEPINRQAVNYEEP
jgi:hypothetical protein